MTTINPYNFVPLGKSIARSNGYPKRHRFYEGRYSGVLMCILKVLSPLISIDQREYCSYTLKDTNGTKLKIKTGKKRGEDYKDIKVFRFLKNSQGIAILQGASIKGMIRSAYEAMTGSCLTLANTNGYEDLGDYLNSNCNRLDALCPTCQLFGVIEGDNIHCQGRVSFSDAVLVKEALVQQRYFLKELSSPKPHHHAIYGKSGTPGGPIAGRKFYYHHGKNQNFLVEECQSNDRSIAIDEYAPVGGEFSFQIQVENLDKDELGKLLLAIELDDGLGHKIGLGKAIGLGSCRIIIDRLKSSIPQAINRYKNWTAGVATDWYSCKDDRKALPESLIEVLRLNKAENGNIMYPDYRNYPKDPIDALGVFGGNATKGGRPSWPDEVAPKSPQEPPPKVKQGEDAAWLKERYEDKLVFVNTQGKEVVRSRKGYQGKPGLLETGKWFILSGTNSSRRA
ncbi:MAG TPA: RAMP superfamily CRISPR-associated protein [Candidatus Brocadiaceae bacterium]|nr:RAMP superfamily CRISPR-associated protein [Candidatus Brocadiaceae bacterium]